MSRKKVVKSAARKNQQSKQATKTTTSSIVKMEAEFFHAPAKLAEQLAKDVAALKQKETKLATTLTKIQAQVAKIEKSIAAAKKLTTAAGRKQLAAAKKVLNDTKKDYALSNVALKDTVKAIADAELKLARIHALAKHLKTFDKEWTKQAKALKTKAKTKAASKSKAPAKRRRTAAKAQAPVLTVVEQPDFDSAVDDQQLDDAKLANS